MAFGAALFKMKALADSNAAESSVFINIEAHSIAFSCLYLWIIPAVMLASAIGVSQSKRSLPEILDRFRIDMTPFDSEMADQIQVLNECLDQTETRKVCGGIYSCQWARSQARSPLQSKSDVLAKEILAEQKDPEAPSPYHKEVVSPTATNRYLVPPPGDRGIRRMWLPYAILLVGTAAGLLMSGYVPPDGINCRHIAEILLVSIWIGSAQLNRVLLWMFPVNKDGPNKALFWLTYAKDSVAVCLTMGVIIIIQVGLLNRSVCWTRWGRVGLAMPQAEAISRVLHARLHGLYPAITVIAIVVEFLLIPLLVWWRYRDALRIFVQRDDGTSNLPTMCDIGKKRRKGGETGHCKSCIKGRRRRQRRIMPPSGRMAATSQLASNLGIYKVGLRKRSGRRDSPKR